MGTTPIGPHHPINNGNGHKNHNAPAPPFGHQEAATNSEEGKQDRPYAAQQRILVKQEEPQQERWYKAQAV